jgi:gamma-glutamylaminecyclotransferase
MFAVAQRRRGLVQPQNLSEPIDHHVQCTPCPPLVFVFGTLKQGFPNAATNRGARWPGNFRTEAAFPLFLVGERHVPWLLNAPGTGLPVIGEVYAVDEARCATWTRWSVSATRTAMCARGITVVPAGR